MLDLLAVWVLCVRGLCVRGREVEAPRWVRASSLRPPPPFFPHAPLPHYLFMLSSVLSCLPCPVVEDELLFLSLEDERVS